VAGFGTLHRQQARALAYLYVLWVMTVVVIRRIPAALPMKRSMAETGARVSTE